MHLRELQRLMRDFEMERGWDRFPASLTYVHLLEELWEIGEHILFNEGYKKAGLGHREPLGNVDREFAQALSLLLQLSNSFNVDLEDAFQKEYRVMEGRFDKEAWRNYMEKYGR